MKEHTHLFRAYLYKMLRSPNIYIGIVGLAAVCCLSRTAFGMEADSLRAEVISSFDLMLNIDAMRKTVVIFGALPFAANFAEEWKHSVTKNVVSRCGAGRYAVCNIICVFSSAVVTVFLGLLLFTGILSVFADMFCSPTRAFSTIEKPFEYLFRNGLPFFYIVYKSFVLALSCGAWAVIGLAVSSFFPNKYVAVCAPLAVSFLLERITFSLPPHFSVACVQNSDIQLESFWGQLAYSFVYFAAIAAIGGVLFGITVKRRVRNEAV